MGVAERFWDITKGWVESQTVSSIAQALVSFVYSGFGALFAISALMGLAEVLDRLASAKSIASLAERFYEFLLDTIGTHV
jgi:hypothetical protein